MKYRKNEIVEMEQLSATNYDLICNFLGYTPEQIANPLFDFDGHGNTRDNFLGIWVRKYAGEEESETIRCALGDCIVRVGGQYMVMNPWDFKNEYEKVEE